MNPLPLLAIFREDDNELRTTDPPRPEGSVRCPSLALSDSGKVAPSLWASVTLTVLCTLDGAMEVKPWRTDVQKTVFYYEPHWPCAEIPFLSLGSICRSEIAGSVGANILKTILTAISALLP